MFTTTFLGPEVDLGADNPSLGPTLTLQQKRKAFTLQVGRSGFHSMIFRLGATPGLSSRSIQFNFQATLLCAQTQMLDGTLMAATDISGGNIFPRANGGEPATD